MGLDMYLYCNSKKVCQSVNDQADEWEGKYQTPRGIAIYWRKANAIHRWFVSQVQHGHDDCKLHEVEVMDLVLLHDVCKQVLDSTKLVDAEIENGQKLNDKGEWEPIIEKEQKLEDPSVAMELLPVQEGFFFGSQAYDQWYWWDLQYTERKLAALLDCLKPKDEWRIVHKDEPDWYVKLYYQSSW